MTGFPGCGAGMLLIYGASRTHGGTHCRTMGLLFSHMVICVQPTSSSLLRVLLDSSPFSTGSRQVGTQIIGNTVRPCSQLQLTENGVGGLIDF
jgi:hypothetical protein